METGLGFSNFLAQIDEVGIRADKLAHYEHVARIMSIAAKAGMTRIGFITDPSEK